MRKKNFDCINLQKALKIFSLFLCVILSVYLTNAQSVSPRRYAHGFSTATKDMGNISYSLGQPFAKQLESPSYSVAEGVQQAQLIKREIYLAGLQNDSLAVSPTHVQDTSGFFLGYAGIEKMFDGRIIRVFPEGHYDSTSTTTGHYSWKATFNYDSITTLVMDIWSIYELFDTLYLDSLEILTDYAHTVLLIPDSINQPLHGGPNTYHLKTSGHYGDSIRHYFVNLCGGLVPDADGNLYASLYVGEHPGKYCWTKSNLKTTTYVTGGDVPNMIYNGGAHTDEDQNLATYGRLYNWYAAVNLPTGSPDDPPTTINGGYVTGLCPYGWHIPDSANMHSLNSINSFDLMSDILWIVPGNDTGAGFYALPAGFYNGTSYRFENMLGETHFWSCVRRGLDLGWVCSMVFGCNFLVENELYVENGLSVRCVKNQRYDANGFELND